MMDIVKKNLISILCGVVALGAVVAAFIPLGGMVAADQESLKKDKATYEQMNGLLSKSRQMPAVDADKAEQETLPTGVFPGPEIIKQGQEIVAQMKKESEAMRDAAVAMNKHELLVPGSLPSPRMQSPQIQFRERYRELFTPRPPSLLPPVMAPMRPGVPPTAQEIEAKRKEIADKITRERLLMVNNQPINQPQVMQEITDAVAKLPEQMRTDVANKSLVYAMPDAFEAYRNIAGGNAPDPTDIFAAQLMLWIQQDIVQVIAQTNTGSKSVLDAPVKRLVRLTITPSLVVDPAVSTAGDPDAAITKSVLYPTGRVSNPLYDVIHFTLNVDVEAAKLNKFLIDMGRNRLITPTQVNVTAVDLGNMLGQGFVYGKEPVVNAQIECEMLLMRQWLLPLMPPAVKQFLKIDQPAAPAQ